MGGRGVATYFVKKAQSDKQPKSLDDVTGADDSVDQPHSPKTSKAATRTRSESGESFASGGKSPSLSQQGVSYTTTPVTQSKRKAGTDLVFANKRARPAHLLSDTMLHNIVAKIYEAEKVALDNDVKCANAISGVRRLVNTVCNELEKMEKKLSK